MSRRKDSQVGQTKGEQTIQPMDTTATTSLINAPVCGLAKPIDFTNQFTQQTIDNLNKWDPDKNSPHVYCRLDGANSALNCTIQLLHHWSPFKHFLYATADNGEHSQNLFRQMYNMDRGGDSGFVVTTTEFLDFLNSKLDESSPRNVLNSPVEYLEEILLKLSSEDDNSFVLYDHKTKKHLPLPVCLTAKDDHRIYKRHVRDSWYSEKLMVQLEYQGNVCTKQECPKQIPTTWNHEWFAQVKLSGTTLPNIKMTKHTLQGLFENGLVKKEVKCSNCSSSLAPISTTIVHSSECLIAFLVRPQSAGSNQAVSVEEFVRLNIGLESQQYRLQSVIFREVDKYGIFVIDNGMCARLLDNEVTTGLNFQQISKSIESAGEVFLFEKDERPIKSSSLTSLNLL